MLMTVLFVKVNYPLCNWVLAIRIGIDEHPVQEIDNNITKHLFTY